MTVPLNDVTLGTTIGIVCVPSSSRDGLWDSVKRACHYGFSPTYWDYAFYGHTAIICREDGRITNVYGFTPDASSIFKYVLTSIQLSVFGEARGDTRIDMRMLNDPRAKSVEVPVASNVLVRAFPQFIQINKDLFPVFKFRPDVIGYERGGNCIYFAMSMLIEYLVQRGAGCYSGAVNDLLSIMSNPRQIGCLQGILMADLNTNAHLYQNLLIGNIEDGY